MFAKQMDARVKAFTRVLSPSKSGVSRRTDGLLPAHDQCYALFRLTLRNEFGIEIGAKPLNAAFAAVAGFFDAAERRLRSRDGNRVDAHHARLHGFADGGRGRVRSREGIGSEPVG